MKKILPSRCADVDVKTPGMGMSLTVADFRPVSVMAKAAAIGLANQLVLLPLIAFGVALALSADPGAGDGGDGARAVDAACLPVTQRPEFPRAARGSAAGSRRGAGGRSAGMEYVFVLVGLVVFAVVAGALLVFAKGRSDRSGPIKAGRETVDREDLPRAEKEQMDAPQEEFIDQEPPSCSRPG